MTKKTNKTKKIRLILVLPSKGVDIPGITDKTNKAMINNTVAIILEKVIFVGKFIFATSIKVSLRSDKPCFV